MSQKEKVLIIEDEESIARFTGTALKRNGYDVLYALSGQEGLSIASSHTPDLVVLDLGLPDTDGLEVLRRLRSWTSMPVIVVSARTHEHDKVEALDLGADDYLTKPFGTAELLARIRTALRHTRTGSENNDLARTGVLKTGALQIDYGSRTVTLEGEKIHLTQNEFKILSLLGIYIGKVLTYDFIMTHIWGPAQSDTNQILRVHMANIRRKIEKNPAEPQYIITEVGVGYRLQDCD